jgi:Putative metal-binding motif
MVYRAANLAGCFALVIALSGCFFLPYRPSDLPDPYGDYSHGSDPDWDDDGDGYTEIEGDCDDEDAAVFPGAVEVINQIDDDCDGDVDEPPDPVDQDGDGWTPEDGDCDDGDPEVHPTLFDGCDDKDNDCDGVLNEDAASDDPQEPNDVVPYHFGNLTNEVATVAGYLHNVGDVDRFSFLAEDTLFGSFSLEVDLTGVPGNADYVLELWLGSELLAMSDTMGGESLVHDGDTWSDDSGTYEVVVYSVLGYSCDHPYVLRIQADG